MASIKADGFTKFLGPVVVALLGWVVWLSFDVGTIKGQHEDLKSAEADSKKVLTEVKDLSGRFDGVGKRLDRVEQLLDLIARSHFDEGVPKAKIESARTLEGVWDVRFGRGETGSLHIVPVDDNAVTFQGREESKGRTILTVIGTGKLSADKTQLVMEVTVKPAAGGTTYSGKTFLRPAGDNSLSGSFNNARGNFDTVTLTRQP